MNIEREDHVSASIGVPGLQQAFPVGNRCIQRRIGSGAVTKAGRWTLPSCGIWQQDIDVIRAELP